MTAVGRPTGKAQRRDRVALARLWGLLYRAVRRTSARVDRQQQVLDERQRAHVLLQVEVDELRERVDELSLGSTWLRTTVEDLTRRNLWLRARLERGGILDEGEGLP